MGINELPITKGFMQEHGEKKMKVSWAEYLKILREEKEKKKPSKT